MVFAKERRVYESVKSIWNAAQDLSFAGHFTGADVCGFCQLYWQLSGKNESLLELHETNCYKQYCFDQPYPLEKDGIYKEGKVYTVRVRTVSDKLAQYFADYLANHYNHQIKGLTVEIMIIPQKFISQIFSITPVVIKCDGTESGRQVKGYWKKCISFEQYEERLKSNLIKNIIDWQGKNRRRFWFIPADWIENYKPIAVPYKGRKLLGDKVCLQAAENEQAQALLYMALGTGLGEMNARGCGFANYRYL